MSRRDDEATGLEALEALFVDGQLPDPGQTPGLRARLREDDEARARFDELAHAARALEQTGPEERSQFERAFGQASFLGALDDMLEQEQLEQEQAHADLAPADAPTETDVEADTEAEILELPTWRRPRAWAAAAAGLAAFVGAGLLLSPPEPPRTSDGEFQARSAAPDPDPTRMWEAPRVEVFCAIRDDQGQIRFRDASQASFGVVRCPRDAELKLAYHAPDEQLRYVAMVGVDERGGLLWYGPSPASPGARPARHDEELVPFGESIRLAVNHAPGVVRVHALFSTRPLPHDKMARWLERHEPEELRQRAALPTHAIEGATTSVTFEVTEEAGR